jgi:hypothetical protein
VVPTQPQSSTSDSRSVRMQDCIPCDWAAGLYAMSPGTVRAGDAHALFSDFLTLCTSQPQAGDAGSAATPAMHPGRKMAPPGHQLLPPPAQMKVKHSGEKEKRTGLPLQV